ncbi:MAG TPA: SpoIIE family protein phosphatase [Thermoanaerobaculia bacterium]|nr:SpoIIE family protein phosphatase [Thermoanaerobaculia bacterium]
MNRPPSPNSGPDAGAAASGILSWPSPQTWTELLALLQEEAGDRAFLERAVELWRQVQGADAAALYLDKGGFLEREAAAGQPLPEALESSSVPSRLGSLPLPGGRLLFAPQTLAVADGPSASVAGAIVALLASALKGCRLKQELKEQQFQVNYRVVELEALYDVGLAVTATLDLDRLSEEILLRAASLLDARRGALYILENGRYRCTQTFGGEAADSFSVDNPELRLFLTSGGPAPENLLPGARYLLGTPVEVENGPRGLLAVGDKESRRGVGPFPASDRRTLALFANQAAIALENARLHLEALDKERLEREMQLAAEIQRRILPKGAPQIPGLQLIGWNRPARQVGGDYYDLFHMGEDRVGLVVGDVSGKGIPAALMVSTLHSALRLLLDHNELGPSLLELLNRHIMDSSTPNKFITMVLGELDLRTGVLRYLNAGHNPGLVLRRDGTVEEMGAGGLPLGLLPAARFQAADIFLGPGDLLCLYSDGITECESLDGGEFGMGRLIDLLREHRDKPLTEVLETIQVVTGRFSEGLPQGDDQTVVMARRE